MAVLVRTCCCGCDLRTGILLIGIFGLLGSAYSIYSEYHSFQVIKDARDSIDTTTELPVDKKYFDVVVNLAYAGIAFGVISLLVNLSLLLSGFGSGNYYLAFPWFLWSIFGLFYSLGVTIFLIAIWNGFAYVFVGTIIAWVIAIYFIIVVYSYMEALREDPSGSTAGFPSRGAGVVIVGPPPYAKMP